MPPVAPPAAVSGLADLTRLVSAGDVLIVSGAGISTDSGIPDYRGPDGTLEHHAPMTFDRFVASEEDRRRYWARSHLGWQRIARARPNASHDAVARLDHAGLLTGVVTQNVDGLHTAAGTGDVIDLHGRLDAVVCLGCRRRRPRIELALRLDVVNPGFAERATSAVDTSRPDGDVSLPDHVVADFAVVDCRACGGVLKPDVVFFGEAVPRDRFHRALARLDGSRSLLVLGSSLTVGSGYRFVTAAKRRGAPIAIVNRGRTRGDRHADLKIDAPLADVLPRVARSVAGTAPPPGPPSVCGRPAATNGRHAGRRSTTLGRPPDPRSIR